VWAPHVTVFWKAHVAYIPNGKIVGLSKIPSCRCFQEEECRCKTDQIKDCIQEALEPLGVAGYWSTTYVCKCEESKTKFFYHLFFTGAFEKTKQEKNLLVIEDKLS
jgi:GTP cyclohydrolase I